MYYEQSIIELLMPNLFISALVWHCLFCLIGVIEVIGGNMCCKEEEMCIVLTGFTLLLTVGSFIAYLLVG